MTTTMRAEVLDRETDILMASAAASLSALLPDGWSALATRDARVGSTRLEITTRTGGATSVATLVAGELRPTDVRRLGPSSVPTSTPLVVVTPWIDGESQRLLIDRGIGFIDLVGNVWLTIDQPAVHVSSASPRLRPSADAAPSPLTRRGAVCLMRALADVAPPHRVRDLAARSGLSDSYVSQLLQELAREGLIQRGRLGRVDLVDLAQIVLRLADTYDPTAFNRPHPFVARRGIDEVVADLRRLEAPVVLTGAFGAAQLVPTPAAELLVGYCDQPELVASRCDLDPAGPGAVADVVLLEPFDDVLVANSWIADHLTYASPVQIAVDCLTLDDRAAAAAAPAMLGWLPRVARR